MQLPDWITTISPFAIRDLMKDSALFHSTAFPLRHFFIPGKSLLESIREIIYESIKDADVIIPLNGDMMETLKWIAYEKWTGDMAKGLTPFGCPTCGENIATLPYDTEKGICSNCEMALSLVCSRDTLALPGKDYSAQRVFTDYMAVCETLMIFSPS